jgi:type II secretory pathway pseudopilin PulG
MHRRNKEGYSLVEVSLALLVVAIGLLTIFALFPDGLDLSRKSVDATEVTAFAEFVFASLDGMASSTNANSWNVFRNNVTNLPPTYILTNTPLTQLYIRPMGNSTPQLFYWIPSFYGELGIAPAVETYQVASFTYLLDIGQTGVVSRYARLEVWPGDVSNRVRIALSTNEVFEGSTVFYRTYLPLK